MPEYVDVVRSAQNFLVSQERYIEVVKNIYSIYKNHPELIEEARFWAEMTEVKSVRNFVAWAATPQGNMYWFDLHTCTKRQ